MGKNYKLFLVLLFLFSIPKPNALSEGYVIDENAWQQDPQFRPLVKPINDKYEQAIAADKQKLERSINNANQAYQSAIKFFQKIYDDTINQAIEKFCPNYKYALDRLNRAQEMAKKISPYNELDIAQKLFDNERTLLETKLKVFRDNAQKKFDANDIKYKKIRDEAIVAAQKIFDVATAEPKRIRDESIKSLKNKLQSRGGQRRR